MNERKLELNTLTKIFTTAAVSVALILGGSVVANAATGKQPAILPVSYYNKVVNKSFVGNYINKANRVGICGVTTRNTTCSISSGKTAARTVDLAFGASRGLVTGSIGISNASSTTIQVSCNSPKMNPGQYFQAYPLGRRYQYQIAKHIIQLNRDSVVSTSAWLHAFDPYSSGISCGLA